MKKSIILFLCLFAFLFGLLGCGEQRGEEAAPYENAERVPVFDLHVPIFEGRWKISRVIPSGNRRGVSKSDKDVLYDLIDDEISISSEEILYNDIAVFTEPRFECNIISTNRARDYDSYIQPNDPSDVYNENSPYFVYIFLALDSQKNETDIPFFSVWERTFIIKDENTIIFRTGVGLLEAVRISYPQAYGVFP